jgi:aryl-alcohol dehydrogenase-like predicted oxidoreductase
MEYRNLGRSGVKVSVLCLGTMMFGGRTNEADSKQIIARAREHGVNFLDTADAYNKGESERIIGRALRGGRDGWVIATKVYNPMGEGPNERGLSRKWLIQACAASLERLATDYIDVYYLHKEELGTPLEETIATLGDLVAQGKIRYFGVSNFRAWRVAEVCRICDDLGVPRPVVSQPVYNMFNRMPEVEHLPACAHYGLGVYPYSPLARGVLTGKYDPQAAPAADTRAGVKDKRIMETEWRPESLALAQQIKAYAESRGTTAAHFALAWVLYNKLITGVVVGPRTLAQWDGYLGGLEYRFTPEDEKFVDALVVPGHPSTAGYNDPAYPIEGRPARE